MQLPVNHFKQALKDGRQQLGLWRVLIDAYSAELVANSGFDWVLIDTEHSPSDVDTVLAQLQAMAPYPSSPVVRPAWNDRVLIKRYLDIGATTLLVPYVQSRAEAEHAVESMRYPPRGKRGVTGMSRASRFGRVPNYLATAESELCLLVQVETAEALGELEAIAAVDGVDGVFIGPSDLAASMGHLGKPAAINDTVLDAIRRVRATGKAAGLLSLDEGFAHEAIAAGAQFTAVGVDAAILARETEKLAARFRT